MSKKAFVSFFTESEEATLLRTLRRVDDLLAKRDLAWMELLRSTSIRISALAGLTVWDAHLSLKSGQLELRAELVKGKKADHAIPLNKRATKSLQSLLRINKKMSKSWGDRSENLPLVLSRNHNGMSIRSFQARMQYWISLSGLKGGSPHWWRHTWAKRALKNSTNRDYALVSVQKILGHSDIRTTTLYTQPDKTDLEDIMRDSE